MWHTLHKNPANRKRRSGPASQLVPAHSSTATITIGNKSSMDGLHALIDGLNGDGPPPFGAGPSLLLPKGGAEGPYVARNATRKGPPCPSAEVVAQVVVIQRDGVELGSSVTAQGVVREVTECAGAGEQVGLCFLSGLDGDLGVAREARAGRDQLTDDDILLQAQQRIALAFHGRLRQDAGGLLEGSCGQPGLGGQRRLGDTHELGTSGSRSLALGHNAAVGIFEAAALCQLTGEQV